MFCMKSIGEQVKEFRESKGWNSTRMAKEVGTSRQNIENLELKGNRKPHYISDLARVMGTTVDAMLAGAPQSSQQDKNSLAAVAFTAPKAAPKLANHHSLDRLFDFLPNDPVLRAIVFHKASAVILDALNGRPSTTSELSRTETPEKSRA